MEFPCRGENKKDFMDALGEGRNWKRKIEWWCIGPIYCARYEYQMMDHDLNRRKKWFGLLL